MVKKLLVVVPGAAFFAGLFALIHWGFATFAPDQGKMAFYTFAALSPVIGLSALAKLIYDRRR